MDSKWKKIIAGEGLVILGFVVFGALVYSAGGLLIKMHSPPLKEQGIISTEELLGEGLYIQRAAPYTALGYLFYLVVRFITWAVRTLKQK